MEPRAALTVAIVAGLLAVGVVALDSAYGLEARLDARDANGEWFTVAQSPSGHGGGGRYAEPHGFGGCAREELRLIVDNHKPFGDSVRVRIWYWNESLGRSEFLLRDTWELSSFEEREATVTVAANAFPANPDPQAKPTLYVNAKADDLLLSACVTSPEAS